MGEASSIISLRNISKSLIKPLIMLVDSFIPHGRHGYLYGRKHQDIKRKVALPYQSVLAMPLISGLLSITFKKNRIIL